ncbi:enoyl-CoA hydratase/isomerase family protein [Nocardia sp. NPDC059236]|uniref:enoyl-CoA hydratase/isomerase family protein n=1 Tax=Nocardia sp. NPDC059236 TaxID=3346783 RepID=UPI00368C574E
MTTNDVGVRRLEIDNPPANAINTAVAQRLSESIAAANDDPAVRCLVIGSVGKHYSLGADIKALAVATTSEGAEFLGSIRAAFDAVESARVPTIAAIGGMATGGGAELALACDIRIVSPDARLALPEVRLGLLPGAGGTQRLVDIAGIGVALDLILTGRTIDADEALRLGLVSRIAQEPITAATELGRQLAGYPQAAVSEIRRVFTARRVEGRGAGFQAEGEAIGDLLRSADARSAIEEFVNRSTQRTRASG